MGRQVIATIDRIALLHNFSIIERYAPGSRVLAMVKSNAYGHDLKTVVQTLANKADGFGVASIEEALQCREMGITSEIVLMQGFFKEDELPSIVQNNLSIVVHNHYQLQVLQQTHLSQPITVWLKINTGMNRLGVLPHEVSHFWHALAESPNVKKPIVLTTHFAGSDDPLQLSMRAQFELFQEATAGLPGPRSTANSGAILHFSEAHGAWVRPGIMLYGVAPFQNEMGQDYELKPVMTLSSQLIAIHNLNARALVGYGGTYQCPEAMRVGIVTIGYGDGYPRHAQSGTPVLIRNTEVPLAGRVAMDMIAVDLRLCPQAQIGDPVILWGKGLPVEKIATHADTIPYELLCHITRRVEYQFI
jgi:alanine racemase